MKKFYRNGRVAVIIHIDYGCGWYSDIGIKEILFDPDIVQLILEKSSDYVEKIYDILFERYMDKSENEYGELLYKGIIKELDIHWVDEGRYFIIKEYDGVERVVLIEYLDIHTA